MNPIKKRIFTAVVALGCSLAAAMSTVSAQTALFIYNDGNGVPNAGTYHPGDSFTFSINLAFTPGGSVSNLDGLSYWFHQLTAAPYISSITLRDVTGSPFTDLQTNLTYPLALNPSETSDLGALRTVGQPAEGAGSYLIANITVTISPSAPVTGTFVLADVTSGGDTSVITDSLGHTFDIPEADYTITMVPEPSTWAAGFLILVGVVFSQRKRFLRSSVV